MSNLNSSTFLSHKSILPRQLTISSYYFQSYWNFDLECKLCKHKTALQARLTGSFERERASKARNYFKPAVCGSLIEVQAGALLRSFNSLKTIPTSHQFKKQKELVWIVSLDSHSRWMHVPRMIPRPARVSRASRSPCARLKNAKK